MAGVTTVPAQSLECVICKELYDEPKQLSCTHTFCQKCLADLLDFNINDNKLTCPVCRQTTRVKKGDVSKLQTNFPIKSLVEDIKAAEQMCTVCDQGTRSKAVAYCQTCGVYMCISCLDAHGKFKLNKKHEVVDSKDIKSGMVKLKQLCKKHPQEEMEWVCSTCKVPICFRCRMLYHNGPNHEVKEVAEIQKSLKDEAKTLQKESEDTLKVIKDHITVTKGENVKSCTMLDERVADVIRAFEDSLENLTKQKNELIEKLQKCKEEMTGNLQDIEEGDLKLFNDISSTRDLITQGAAGFLEGESLVVHQRLCTELRQLMNKADCDDKIPGNITEQAESIKFTRSQSQQDLKLGELTLPGMDSEAASANLPRALEQARGDKLWNLKKMHSLSTLGHSVYDMAPTPDGRMAVCYHRGGIDLFTVNGLLDTVLEQTTFRSLRFLSDGRCSVIDTNKSFSLYSPKFEKVPSPGVQASGCCWVCVSKDNEILIRHIELEFSDLLCANVNKNFLSVYRPDSREFVRREWDSSKPHVSCDYAVSQMNHRPYYIGIDTLGRYLVARIVNDQFQGSINYVKCKGSKSTPVVLKDDSILIGWYYASDTGGSASATGRSASATGRSASVTVELYTHDLRYVRTVLKDFKMYGEDFVMAAFSTGEIAICDSRQLHVFRKDYQV